MKRTAMVRKLDSLGRICIPKNFRDYLGLVEGENDEVSVEFFVREDQIILKKYEPVLSCVFCGDVTEGKFKGLRVCGGCLEEICG